MKPFGKDPAMGIFERWSDNVESNSEYFVKVIIVLNNNPCLSCGACCGFYRVSFYWGETDMHGPEGVPSDMTVKINEFYVAMKGTEAQPARCIALSGSIGESVACTIYTRRPLACRNFMPAWQDSSSGPWCGKARLAHGLPALHPNPEDNNRPLPQAA